MTGPAQDPTRAGWVFALLAYGTWGLSPLFWKQLVGVGAEVQLAHRILWAAVLLGAVVLVRGRGAELVAAVRSPSTLRAMIVSALLIGVNWGVYLYAVVTERIVEASLGYYLNPLVTVLLGAALLGEPLSTGRRVAVALAAAGVAVMTWQVGSLPWLAVVLSSAFALYGYVRKTSDVSALPGTVVETSMLAIPAVVAVVGWEISGPAPMTGPEGMPVWLLLAGPVTALPLLSFSAAARRLPLSTLGVLQFATPTMQLGLAVGVYGEPFTGGHLAAFGLIWTGVALWVWEGRRAWRAPAAVAPAPTR